MNNKPFQQTLKLVFALALVVSLLLPASSTLALPQKAAPLMDVLVPFEPNDAQYSSQWHYSGTYGINAPEAWGIAWDTTANSGAGGTTAGLGQTVVAVLDTGYMNHEDLDPARKLPGYDFVTDMSNHDTDGRDDDPKDPGDWCASPAADSSWQGTHVAGIIGAASNNTTGVAGINWTAKILPVRVLGNCRSATADDIRDGMRWAADLPVDGVNNGPVENTNPADVIHVSASVATSCSAYQADIDAIIGTGAVIVAAAGDNNADAGSYFPANCNGVITVAATDEAGYRTSTSNYGSTVEISAPGGNVFSTSRTGAPQGPEAGNDGYVGMAGTAMAAAHVSGAVSLMYAVNPLITPTQVSQILQKTVKAFPGGGTCTTSNCGWGILDAGEAVRYANMPDLVITNAALSNEIPFREETFKVNVSVKNQGGRNLKELSDLSVTYLLVYIDRDPSALTRTEDGCLQNEGVLDLGEFKKIEDTVSVPSGETRDLEVIINDPTVGAPIPNTWTDPLFSDYYDDSTHPALPWGSGAHNFYVYVDANCIVDESYEDNNKYPTVVKVNPFIEGAMLYPRQGQNIGTDYNPVFEWNEVLGLNGYRIYVSGPNAKLLFDKFYETAQICNASTNKCYVSMDPTITLGGGSYSWWIRPWSSLTGYGAWSAETKFTTTSPTVPLGATLTAPKNAIQEYTPAYTWNKVDTATYYRLQVKGPGNVAVLDKWYKSADICPTTTCSVVSPMLKGGSHIWWLQTYSPAGYGPWVSQTFNTPAVAPGPATLLEPNNTAPLTNYTPTYKWNKVNTVTSYRLLVRGPGNVLLLDKWYTASSICDVPTVGECSVVSPVLKVGSHVWWLQTYNPAGYGPWVSQTFTTATGTPGGATLLEPNNTAPLTNYTPTYKWNKVDTVTSYRLQVVGPGNAVVLDKWYTASSVCDVPIVGECLVLGPTLKAGSHTWWVQTYNPVGYGPWASQNFSTSTDIPAGATLLEPNDAAPLTNLTPTYKWNKVDKATYYRLLVRGPGNVLVLDKWYATSSVCDVPIVGECSVVSPALKGGSQVWWMQTYNPAGYGPWASQAFSTSTGTPGQAVLKFPVPDVPGGVENISTDYNPTYTWYKTDKTVSYRLYVRGPKGVVVLDKWYQSSAVCDVATLGECSVVSPTLTGGAYSWWLQTYNSAGYGPWTAETKFSTDTQKLPVGAVLVSPKGTTAEHTQTYAWTKVPQATWYRVYVKGPNGLILDKWYQTLAACVGDACSVAGPRLESGNFIWWVQTYNSAGYGPWKSATFKVSP